MRYVTVRGAVTIHFEHIGSVLLMTFSYLSLAVIKKLAIIPGVVREKWNTKLKKPHCVIFANMKLRQQKESVKSNELN